MKLAINEQFKPLFEPLFEPGAKVRVRTHTREEKDQYHSHYHIFWSSGMDRVECHVGTVTKCDKSNGHHVYTVLRDGYEHWFAESSLQDTSMYDMF